MWALGKDSSIARKLIEYSSTILAKSASICQPIYGTRLHRIAKQNQKVGQGAALKVQLN